MTASFSFAITVPLRGEPSNYLGNSLLFAATCIILRNILHFDEFDIVVPSVRRHQLTINLAIAVGAQSMFL